MASSTASKIPLQESENQGADNVIFFKGTQQQSSRIPQETDKNEIFYKGAGACPKQKGKEGRKWVNEENPFANHKFQWDLDNLTATDLKNAYPSEYSSHKNRKHHCKVDKWEWDPRLNLFRHFLRILGPKPDPSYTLDRDDYSILAYAPDNCQWRSKTAQTRNRGNTKFIEDSQGNKHTWAEWAKITKIKASTLCGRYAGSWSIDDALYTPVGQSRGSTTTKTKSPASNGLWSLWDRLLREHPDQSIVIATGKDRKMLGDIKNRFEEVDLDPRAALEWTLTNWDEFKCFAKDYGVWKNQYVPTVQLLAWSPKLGTHGALGLLEEMTREDQIIAFAERAERQLLVALHEATRGKRFEDIVFEEYIGIVPEEARRLYLDICTLNQFGVSVRAGTIARVSGIQFHRFRDKFFKPLENVVLTGKDRYTGDYNYKARHAKVAGFVFRRACETADERVEQLVRLVDALDIGYSIDEQGFERLLKAHMLVRIISDVEAGRRLFGAAVRLLPGRAFIYQQWAIYELHAIGGSLAQAQVYADKAHEMSSRSQAIIHTQAEIARRRANEETSEALKDQYRRQARERLREISRVDNRFAFATQIKLLVDEIEDLISASDDKINPVSENSLFIEKVNDAENYLTRAQQLFSNDTEFSEIDARLRKALSQKEKLIAALERALSAGPRHHGVAIRLSAAYRARGDSDGADKVLESALERAPDSKPVHFAIARAMLEDRSDQIHKIEEHLSRSYDRGDQNFDARHLYAQFLFREGRAAEAVALFEEIHERAPEGFLQQVSRSHSAVSKHLPPYSGRVTKKLESILFISVPSYPNDVYANEAASDFDDWNAIAYGSEVEFEVRFNRIGPVAVGVKLRSI